MSTRHCVSHLLMPPYFLLLLCTFSDESNASWLLKHDKSEGDWKKSHSSKSWSWQLFFCSVAGRWVCCLCWLCVHFEVVTCSTLELLSSATVCCRQTCRHFLSSLSSCQLCFHFVADVYPPLHVDSQHNPLSFSNHLVGRLSYLR